MNKACLILVIKHIYIFLWFSNLNIYGPSPILSTLLIYQTTFIYIYIYIYIRQGANSQLWLLRGRTSGEFVSSLLNSSEFRSDVLIQIHMRDRPHEIMRNEFSSRFILFHLIFLWKYRDIFAHWALYFTHLKYFKQYIYIYIYIEIFVISST